MTTDRPDAPLAVPENARALADDLREICERLTFAELRDDDVAAARALAQELRDRLAGPRRERWYDAPDPNPGHSPESRRAYLAESPIRGELNPIAPPLVLQAATRADGRRCLRGEVTMGRRYEGPPHGVHGGFVAALFDEALGATQGIVGSTGMTAVLKVRYRRVTPIGQPLRFESWVHEQRGRRLIARATCQAGGQLTADAEGIFISVDFDEVEQRMAVPRPGNDPQRA